MILAVVPDCKETCANMSILFEITKLNKISFLFVADNKLLLICLGCLTSLTSFPSSYCHLPLKKITSTVDETAENLPEDLLKERTFGNLKKSHDKYTTIYDFNRKLTKNVISERRS